LESWIGLRSSSAERRISSSCSAISALPAIDGRKLIASTYGTVPPGVATTISWPARLSAS
jgi:hypothetical protein